MDIDVELLNLHGKADANRKNVLALVGKLDGQEARVEQVEKEVERRDRELLNMREQLNLLSGQITAMQLLLVEERSTNGPSV